jgi:predicted nucleotidyltransferase
MKDLKPEVLEEIVRRIQEAISTEVIYLYGSHAYGRPHKDSDIDLLIIVSESSEKSHQRAAGVYRVLRGLCVPIEVKVVTRSEFDHRSTWVSSIESIVKRKGKVLHESIA